MMVCVFILWELAEYAVGASLFNERDCTSTRSQNATLFSSYFADGFEHCISMKAEGEDGSGTTNTLIRYVYNVFLLSGHIVEATLPHSSRSSKVSVVYHICVFLSPTQ